jgi:DNA-binding GntR family transcriptional regulator
MSFATYIKQDVIAQICSGGLGNEAVTLESLSARYQVSITPVRIAVKELITEGYLRKGKNRRLEINPASVTPIALPQQPEEPRDYYRIIADDLVKLSLQGEPIAIREEATAEKYNISRSSIRQIFNRLAGDGVLEHLPRRGWVLRPYRQADLDAYLEIRCTLELKALELAWPRLVDEDLQAMLDKNRLPSGPGEKPVSDNSLHGYLVEKAGNPYIAEFFERHGKYYAVLFDWEALDDEVRSQTVEQHRAILESLLRRDRAAAEQALVYHIRNNHPILKDGFHGKSLKPASPS